MGRMGRWGAHRVEVTEAVPAGTEASYASSFSVPVTGTESRRPEEWVRVALEEAPPVLRWLVVAGWRHVLGLRLGPRSSPSHVAGWSIMSNTPERIVLEVGSPLVTASKVLRIEATRVVMTTFVHYSRPAGRVVWQAVAPIHHRTEPYLLRRAATRLRSGRG